MRLQDREREELGKEIGKEEFAALLRRLQEEHAFLKEFGTWAEVAAFMRGGAADDPMKDEVLRPVLGAHARSRDPRWRSILLFIFWSRLKAICRQRREWDPEPEQLWSNTVWAFLQSVCHHDLSRRSCKMFRQLTNSTTRRLGDEYKKARKRAGIETAIAPELLESMAGGVEDAGFAEMEIREEQEACIKRLREHLVAGRITEIDLHLLVGTFVYGKRLRKCAEEAGLSYQAAKKRRRRAEVAIRRHEESEKKSACTCPHPRHFTRSVLLEENGNTNSGGTRR